MKKKDPENPRVITVSEKHGDVYKWLPPTYSLFQETPYTFSAIKDFSCRPKRGGTDKPMFLINHWLRPDGPPDPTEAAHVNSRRTLLNRFRTCAAARQRLPNVLAVDFTAIGDLYTTVNTLNGAIGRLSDVTPDIDKAIRRAVRSGKLSEARLAELRGYRRLPKLSTAAARTVLGPAARRAPAARPRRVRVREPHRQGPGHPVPRRRLGAAAGPDTPSTTTTTTPSKG